MATDNVYNLLCTFELASSEDRQAATWYQVAHKECQAAASACGVDYKRFVYAVAALSPMTSWDVNIQGIVDLATTGKTCRGLGSNRTKALEILSGNLDALSGPKVTRFAKSILNPGKYCQEVVVDTWAWRAWAACPGNPPAIRGKRYQELVADYRQAAEEVGLSPMAFQAVVWVAVRKMAL